MGCASSTLCPPEAKVEAEKAGEDAEGSQSVSAVVVAPTDSKKADVVDAIPVAPAGAVDDDDGDDIVGGTTSFYGAEDETAKPFRRFQIRLGANWTDMTEEELQQLNEGLQKGSSQVTIVSRGLNYVVDVEAKTQTNESSGKSRDIREVEPGGEERPSVVEKLDSHGAAHIDASALGPPCSPFADAQPHWSWLGEKDRWRSYPLSDSIELDRYWQVFQSDKKATVAKIRLQGKISLVDFQNMTEQKEGTKARQLKRETKKPGWLSNGYFYEAFKDALSSGGVTLDRKAEEMFAFQFNQDFRDMKDDGRVMARGGQPYKLPVGWQRFAMQVKGQYDDGDNGWLRDDESGWAVAYHGTAKEALPGIMSAGFHVGERQKFADEVGAGVYCANNIAIAQHYSEPKKWKGHFVQIVLQLRVKPSSINKVTTGKDFEKRYWVINNPEHIRAYGVLIRELPLEDYATATEMVFGEKHRPSEYPKLRTAVRDQLKLVAEGWK